MVRDWYVQTGGQSARMILGGPDREPAAAARAAARVGFPAALAVGDTVYCRPTGAEWPTTVYVVTRSRVTTVEEWELS